MNEEPENTSLSETENMVVWKSLEEDVGAIFHVEFGSFTLHLLPDEWQELCELIANAGE